MFERYQRAVEETQELDLLPVMNLFMVLIPFLLMGAAFFHIGVIPTSLPAHTPQASDVPKTPTTVSVNLAVSATDMQLTVSSTSLDEAQLAALGATFQRGPKGYPREALVKHLRGLKTSYPESNTLIALPHEDLAYDELVAILDATREFPTGKTGTDGEPEMRDLFPVVVFSRFIEAAPEEGAEGVDGAEGAGEGAPVAEEAAP